MSETWLDHTVSNNQFDIPGYHPLFRRDRPSPETGGGVAAWVSCNLVATRRVDLELNELEAIWIEIRFNNHKIWLCTIYRPQTTGVLFWDNMQDMLDHVKLSDIKHLVILGDLNADDNTQHGPYFHNLMSGNNLVSHINEPNSYNEQDTDTVRQNCDEYSTTSLWYTSSCPFIREWSLYCSDHPHILDTKVTMLQAPHAGLQQSWLWWSKWPYFKSELGPNMWRVYWH